LNNPFFEVSSVRFVQFLSTAVLAAMIVSANPYPSNAQAIANPPIQEIALPGSPFAVAATRDGKYVFASLSGATSGIAILKQGTNSLSLVRILPTGGGAFGLAITSDSRYLLDTVQPSRSATIPSGVQIIDLRKAVAGDADAIIGTVPTGTNSGPIEVGLSNDNSFIFVSDENNETVGVIDFKKALRTDGDASSVVGFIPVEQLPVGLAFSGDNRYLYVSNEAANATDPGYDPNACQTPTGIGTGTTPGPAGTLSVIDVRKAETDPVHSVLASVYAGCSPVRVVLSDDSSVAWVTGRAENNVLAFNTSALLNDPANALLVRTPVGTAPVGIQLFDHDRFIAIANSNRFTTGQTGTVSILDYEKALAGAGASATLGTFPAGQFPRQWAVSNNGKFLYLTEFSSNILGVLTVPTLIKDLD
jgi:DNA-binding beta-propeller fold protein YncE